MMATAKKFSRILETETPQVMLPHHLETPWHAFKANKLEGLQKRSRARSDAFLIELSSRAEKRTFFAMFVFIVYLST